MADEYKPNNEECFVSYKTDKNVLLYKLSENLRKRLEQIEGVKITWGVVKFLWYLLLYPIINLNKLNHLMK